MSPRRVIAVSCAVLLGLALAPPPAAQAASCAAYVMGYFNRSGDRYALHLAVSDDGLQWAPLNQNEPVVTPAAGTQGLRDPYILRKQDGTFVVLATGLKGRVFHQNDQYIHVWDSANLTSFTNHRRARLHTMATHSWAPEAFKVPARNAYAVIYSACNGTSNIDGNPWSPLGQRAYTPPISSKHANIIPITTAEKDALISLGGPPRWNRSKSYVFPDRYPRHSGFALRIDPLGSGSALADRQDATFMLTD